jgi:hypothetical protein
MQVDYTNWNAWRNKNVRWLRVNRCTQDIGVVAGVALGFKSMLYEWPMAPVAMASIIVGVMEGLLTAAKQEVEMASYLR